MAHHADRLKNIRDFWYAAALSKTLKNKPLTRIILDQPIVFFRDSAGRAQALLDRCCHRNMPLSTGKVTPAGIQCGYHGWEFSAAGQCLRIPGRDAEARQPLRGCVPAFNTIEQNGLLWVYGTPNTTPDHRPLHIPFLADAAYGSVWFDFGVVHAAAENLIDNFMDSLHAPFIHPGLIYDDKKRNRLELLVRPYANSEGYKGVEGCYLGEPPPTQGLIGKIFSDGSATTVLHVERYIAPAASQVEFKIGNASHLLATLLFTPETSKRTRLYMTMAVKSRVPKFLTKMILRTVFSRLLHQDIEALELQQWALDHFEPVPRSSSELDLLSLTAVYFFQRLCAGAAAAEIPVQTQRYIAHM